MPVGLAIAVIGLAFVILAGRSATDIRLRGRYGINLLAISRQGKHSFGRLRSTAMRTGDVLLLQGTPQALAEFGTRYACAPLAERKLDLPDRRMAIAAVTIMLSAVIAAATGLAPAAISFTAAVLVFAGFGIVRPRLVYGYVDWSVIVLLGALIPVSGALADTGAADLIARSLLEGLAAGNAIVAVGVPMLLVVWPLCSQARP
jgi:di/tricarboxylate transporter